MMAKPILPFCFHTVDLFLFVSFSITPKSASSSFRLVLCVPPFTRLQGCCPSLSPDPFEQRTALLKCKLNNNSSVSANMLLLSQSVSVPCSCPSYQFHILKLKQNTSPTPQKTSNCREITILQLYTVKSSCTAFSFARVWGFSL